MVDLNDIPPEEGRLVLGDASLEDAPDLYPGWSEAGSFFYARGRVWPLELSRNERMTRARLTFRQAASAAETPGQRQRVFLASRLREWGSHSLVARIPVVAIGSNARPRQLFDKFKETYVEDAVPSFKGVLSGSETVYCPFLSPKGYVPVTSSLASEGRADAWLQLLTLSQLEAITKTEYHYQLLWMDGDAGLSFVSNDSLEQLHEFAIFWYDRMLGAAPAKPIVWADSSGSGTAAQDAAVSSEAALMQRLSPPLGLPRPRTEFFDPRDLTDCGLQILANPPPRGAREIEPDEATNYGAAIHALPDVSDTDFYVMPTGPIRHRAGRKEPIAHLTPATAGKRFGDYVAVSRLQVEENKKPSRARRTALPVRRVPSETTGLGEGSRGLPAVCIALDQAVRDGLGVSVGDVCEVSQLRQPRWHRLRRLLARPFRPICQAVRVVKADVDTMERQFCWADGAVLDLLGLGGGGRVRIFAAVPEGSRLDDASPSGPRFEMTSLTLDALPVPETRTESRKKMLVADAEARFPDPEGILSVTPDLPWIWLDAATRWSLGLNRLHSTTPVIVTPSVRYLYLRMLQRFVVANLGIGAAIAFGAQSVLSGAAADAVTVGVLSITILASAAVIVMSGRR